MQKLLKTRLFFVLFFFLYQTIILQKKERYMSIYEHILYIITYVYIYLYIFSYKKFFPDYYRYIKKLSRNKIYILFYIIFF